MPERASGPCPSRERAQFGGMTELHLLSPKLYLRNSPPSGNEVIA